jgi:phage terminase large subunit
MAVQLQLPQKLQPLFEPRRYKVMHGGRGGAKSWSVAAVLLLLAAQRPMRVLCAREIQKSLRDSVYRLLVDQIQRLGLAACYEVLESEIRGRNGSLFLFSGLLEHTIDSIKSFEGVDFVWVEEAHSVSRNLFSKLSKKSDHALNASDLRECIG